MRKLVQSPRFEKRLEQEKLERKCRKSVYTVMCIQRKDLRHMKRNIFDQITRCLNYQQVKAEHENLVD